MEKSKPKNFWRMQNGEEVPVSSEQLSALKALWEIFSLVGGAYSNKMTDGSVKIGCRPNNDESKSVNVSKSGRVRGSMKRGN